MTEHEQELPEKRNKSTAIDVGGISGVSGGEINTAGQDIVKGEKIVAEKYIRAETIIIGEKVGAGLQALGDLVQVSPEARAAVAVFRSAFKTACSQVDILGDYKELHDLLHQIQYSCYDPLVREALHFPDDTALEMMDRYRQDLRDVLFKLQAVAERELVTGSDILWIDEVEKAYSDLKTAIDLVDQKLLQNVLWRLKRLLSTQPSQINTRLNFVAHNLRLPAIVGALTTINEDLVKLPLDPDKVQQFQVGLQALVGLNEDLQVLVADHDRWQVVELELRRIEDQLGRGLEELEMSWGDLKNKAEPLYLDQDGEWAVSLNAYGQELDQAMATNIDPPKIRRAFWRYRREAGSRFFVVDISLKSLCGELRQVGGPMTEVLRRIE